MQSKSVSYNTKSPGRDLFRGGNASEPQLGKVRPGKEYDDTNDNDTLYPGKSPSADGLSTFQEVMGPRGWWKLPAGSLVPSGVHFINDHGAHWALEPDRPISVDEYINIVTTSWFVGLWQRVN